MVQSIFEYVFNDISTQSLIKKKENRVSIQNLNLSTDLPKLHSLFDGYGEIILCKISYSNPGSGFVQFRTKDFAEKALHGFGGSIYLGSALNLSIGEKIETEEDFTRILVKNLPNDFKEEKKILAVFFEFGKMKIESVNPEGDNSVSALISFVKHESAAKAVERANGRQIEGNEISVGRYITKKKPKNKPAMVSELKTNSLGFTNSSQANSCH